MKYFFSLTTIVSYKQQKTILVNMLIIHIWWWDNNSKMHLICLLHIQKKTRSHFVWIFNLKHDSVSWMWIYHYKDVQNKNSLCKLAYNTIWSLTHHHRLSKSQKKNQFFSSILLYQQCRTNLIEWNR